MCRFRAIGYFKKSSLPSLHLENRQSGTTDNASNMVKMVRDFPAHPKADNWYRTIPFFALYGGVCNFKIVNLTLVLDFTTFTSLRDIRHLEGSLYHVPCMGHIINLAVQAMLGPKGLNEPAPAEENTLDESDTSDEEDAEVSMESTQAKVTARRTLSKLRSGIVKFRYAALCLFFLQLTNYIARPELLISFYGIM